MRTTDFMRMSHAQAAMKASDIAYENEQLRQQLEMAEACLAGDNALIVGLKNDIAEKDAEIERLKTVPMKYRRMAFNAQLQDENRELEKQLAASQDREQQLRVFVETLWQIIDDIDTYSDMAKSDDKAFRAMVEGRQKDRWKTGIECDGYSLHHKALAIPQDTAALEAMIAKAGEVATHRAMQACSDLGANGIDYSNYASFVTAIRDLPTVLLEDLK